MGNKGPTYIVGFAVAVCLVCSVLVSGAAVSLRPMQEANKILDKQLKVLNVAGLVKEGASASREEIEKLFKDNVTAKVVDLKTGAYDDTVDAATYDMEKAAKDADAIKVKSKAGIPVIAAKAVIYQIGKAGKVDMIVLPIKGKGLWSTMRGFIAMGTDGNTIKGLTYYSHGETPGLGGEIDNPRWKSLWPGRKAYGADGKVAVRVIKGSAGTPEAAPHQVDGLSGATLTCNGVTNMMQLWLGEQGFGPFLKAIVKGGAS
jgi:Na+-transporting NADH:ubiquinone oxidoreductase subunit C